MNTRSAGSRGVFLLLVLCMVSFGPVVNASSATKADIGSLVTGNNGFAFDLMEDSQNMTGTSSSRLTASLPRLP